MNRFSCRKRNYRLDTALLLLIFLAGCHRDSSLNSGAIMTSLTPRIQSLLQETRTVCFGRFLITVPSTATVVYGPAQAESEIDYYRGEANKIEKLVAARLVEIEEERGFMTERDRTRLPLFGQVRNGSRVGQKIVLGSKSRVGYTVHSYVPLGDDLFVQYISGILPDEDPFDFMNTVANELKPRSEDVIPSEPGVCIEGGLVTKDLTYEQVAIGIRLKEFPDVHLSIEVHRNVDRLAESSSLERMLKEGKENAQEGGVGSLFDRIKIFRHGPRQLGKWTGFEHASRTPANKESTEAHEFFYQSLGALRDPLLPKLEIELNSGVKDNSKASVPPSITDEEALALWDALITTIRVRPTGDAVLAKIKVPLSSLLKTGQECTETGWWECIDELRIEGTRRRLFREGETMPAVARVDTPTMWQKMTGERTIYERPTTWKLVEHAPRNLSDSAEQRQ